MLNNLLIQRSMMYIASSILSSFRVYRVELRFRLTFVFPEECPLIISDDRKSSMRPSFVITEYKYEHA